MDLQKPENDENFTLEFHEKVTNLLSRKEEIDLKALNEKCTVTTLLVLVGYRAKY